MQSVALKKLVDDLLDKATKMEVVLALTNRVITAEEEMQMVTRELNSLNTKADADATTIAALKEEVRVLHSKA